MNRTTCQLMIAIVVALSFKTSAQMLSAPQQVVPSTQWQPTTRPSGDSPADAVETFTTRVREVNLVFSVADRSGRFVSNLTSSDVKVLDNGLPPESVTYFRRHDELPLRVGIAIDTSDSVEQQFRFEQEAAVLFLQQMLRPNSDSALIVGFNGHSALAQGLTADMAGLTKAIHELRIGGETAVWDAVRFSCEELARTAEHELTRHALIVITDGDDNVSHSTLDDAISAALQADTVVFVINTHTFSERSDVRLEKLAKSTGGAILPGHGLRELAKAFHDIDRQLRSQYALGYKPPQWRADHSFHSIRLVAQRRGLRVHCRRGYFAVE
jgi:Ca-activated chloride channel family protein